MLLNTVYLIEFYRYMIMSFAGLCIYFKRNQSETKCHNEVFCNGLKIIKKNNLCMKSFRGWNNLLLHLDKGIPPISIYLKWLYLK